MPFDLSTAKPVDEHKVFDLSTAKPVSQETATPTRKVPNRLQGFMGVRRVKGPQEGPQLPDDLSYEVGGVATDFATKMGLPPKGAAAVGYAANVIPQAVATVLGGEATTIPGTALKAGARDLMQSALKPTYKQLKTGEAAKAIDVLLDEGLNATKGGAKVLKEKIGILNDQIKEAIAGSSATVNKAGLEKSLQGLLDRFSKQVDSKADIAAIKKTWTNFKNNPLLKDVEDIPVQLAQELKQGTYRALKGKYGQLGSAEEEAQKSLARGLKEGISQGVPQVAPLNEQESKLISALNVAERRTLMDMNRNPLSLALLAHRPDTFAAFMADKSALFKSLVARMLNASSEAVPAASKAAGQAAGAAASPSGTQE